MVVIKNRFTSARLRLEREWSIWNLTRQVKANARLVTDLHPVVMFDASTRLSGFSQNAAFALLTGWGLQLAGVPLVHFGCQAGMSRCVLGTNPDDHRQTPPCEACAAQAQRLYASAPTQWFEYQPDRALAAALESLNLEELSVFEFPFNDDSQWTIDRDHPSSAVHRRQSNIPLGPLVLPSLRWALRCHHLLDDAATRFLLREYIQSAYRVAGEFGALLVEVDPRAVVLFNGLQFPEAAARWVARQAGVPVITHEVGFQPFSVFFSHGQVTAYPIEIPDEFELSQDQQTRIESHLSRRFQGEFSMAGITFWPEMNGLSEVFLQRAAQYEQIVPVFTNVIFDTSQVHANTIFPQMFAWLDLVLGVIRAHPETLFVIRAHPDEMREGKKSRESVQAWVTANGAAQLPNLIFVASDEALSSYDLIRRSKFVMVYNSSIGLEATLLGAPVLCGGQARYTQYPTVFLPDSASEYREMMEQFLAADTIEIPPEFARNAWRFLYYQFYRASLPLDQFIEAHPTPGYVQLKRFDWRDLLLENSPTLKVIVAGILQGEPFLLAAESGQRSAVSGQ